jgi:CRP-like cAMP-binding protein
MAIISTLDLIRRVPIFYQLNDAQANLIATGVTKRRVRRGEIIVQQGKKSNCLFLVLAGKARVTVVDSRGREVILASLGPGDCVGEMSLIDDEPHSATVRADQQTDLLILRREEFEGCMPAHNSISRALMLGLVRRLRHANRQIEGLALLDVYGRVARALLDMAAVEGAHRVIRPRVSRQYLANSIGATREVVSRVMTTLEQRRLIQTLECGAVVIHESFA